MELCWPGKGLAAAPGAEFVRRRAGLLAEKAREVRRIGERQVIRDLVDRLAGKHELALRLGEDALANEMRSAITEFKNDYVKDRAEVVAA